MIVYRHTVTVVPRESWRGLPLDMLRYDMLAPATSKDANLIAMSEPDHLIILARWGEATWTPARDRWASYGWDVVAHTRERIR